MDELFDLRIPELVGPRYIVFGLALRIDYETFGILRDPSSEAVKDILSQWLLDWGGGGLPVTWKSLIQALRLSGLGEQADKIEILKGECRKVILKLYTQVEKSFMK